MNLIVVSWHVTLSSSRPSSERLRTEAAIRVDCYPMWEACRSNPSRGYGGTQSMSMIVTSLLGAEYIR